MGCNLDGTLPESISAFVNLETFAVSSNKLTGPLPLSLSAWKKLGNLQVYGNQFSGGPLPELPFAYMAGVSGCALFDSPPTNQFTCPWPAGAVAACHVTDADCSKYSCDEETFQCVESRDGTLTANNCSDSCVGKTCTGNSTKLPQAQCDAWVDFYDATNGDKWTGHAAACTQDDPCSCFGEDVDNSFPVCDATRMTVKNM
jgi:hypothetical protein